MRIPFLPLIVAALAAFALSSCSGGSEKFPGIPTEKGPVQAGGGLRYIDVKEGSGPTPTPGATLKVHYTGFLMDSTKFDSSVDRNEPIEFRIGSGRIIKGWDDGVMSMKQGGIRKLIIPAHLAYGDRGVPGLIPPGSDLVFDVELLEVTPPVP